MTDGTEPTFNADRFRPPTDPDWPGHWASFPRDWEQQPESRLLASETLGLVAAIVQKLPPAQREVLTLRDVDGWTSVEVCNALGLSETNQRVLLHRGRARIPACARLLLPRQLRVMTPPADDFPCNLFVELVTEYLDGALPADETRRLEEHLAICGGCESVLEQFRVLIRTSGAVLAVADVDALTTLRNANR